MLIKQKIHRKIRLQDKDIQLFDFIAKFGFANVQQLHSYLGGSINSLKTRLSHLVNDDYLLNHRIFFKKPSVYTVTKKGNLTELAIVQNISLKDYEHDMLVIDVFLKLKNKITSYTTERMLRTERGVGVGKSGRIPDMVVYTADKKVVAIEVDRTDKSLDRLKTIIVSYSGLRAKYDEVWFICATDLIFNNLDKVAGLSDNVKVFHLKDVLSGNELVYKAKNITHDESVQEVPQEVKADKSTEKKQQPYNKPSEPLKQEKEPKMFGGYIFQ